MGTIVRHLRAGRDLGAVLCVLPLMDLLRHRVGVGEAVGIARRFGWVRAARDRKERAVLRRMIGAIDGRFPRGPNCLRRVLTEIVLDQGAASERVAMGLRTGLALRSGHVWLGSEAPRLDHYDLSVDL